LILFFLYSLQKQKNHLEVKINREKILQQNISQNALQVLKLIEQHERLTAKEIQKIRGLNINTIKKILQKLIQNNLIVKHGKTKGTWYTAL